MMAFGRWYRYYSHEKGTEGPSPMIHGRKLRGPAMIKFLSHKFHVDLLDPFQRLSSKVLWVGEVKAMIKVGQSLHLAA